MVDLSKKMAAIFHEFVENGKIEQLNELTKQAINSKNENGLTALHKATSEGNLAMAAYLIRNGAQTEVEDNFGNTPLIYAAIKNRLEVAKLLISNGAPMNKPNRRGITPLSMAALQGSFDVVKCLITNGADMNSTLLHLSAKSGNLNVVKYLVINGANISTKTLKGRTAFDVAHEHGHKEVAKYLMEKMVELQAEIAIPEEKISNKTPCAICFRPKNGHFALLPCMHATLCESCCFTTTGPK